MNKNGKSLSTIGIASLLVLLLVLGRLFLLPLPASADPGVLYAVPTAQGSGDCSSWADACALQTALTTAVSGDEIWVQAGVHYPGATRESTFTLKQGVALYGGFAGTESARDERDWQVNRTILSGDIDNNDTNTDGNHIAETWNDIRGYNVYHVLRGGADATAVLDGFVVTAGQANSPHWPNNIGGGMYNYLESATLTNVTFSGNLSNASGGGMYNYASSSPVLTNVVFTGNYAFTYGGGIYNEYNSSPTLLGVTFLGNVANSAGGGMYNNGGSPALTNVVFSGNSAGSEGGGMRNYGSSPVLTNVTFSGNSAGSVGGGMHNFSSDIVLNNVILWGNTAPNSAGIYNSASTLTISYSDIQDCGGSGSGWDSACGTDGGGNIEADPLFVGSASGNLRLGTGSPATDAGNNAAVPSGITTDLDGNPRFVDIPSVPDTGNGTPPIVDMGAYETQQVVDVALSKAVLPLTVAPGEPITFTLTLTSTGSITATGVVVTDTLATWLENVSFTSTLSVTDTGHLPPYAWLVQDLAPGQGGVITVSGILTAPLAAGVYTNTAVITATGDLPAGNNTAVVTFTVANVAPAFTSAPVVTATQDVPYTYTAAAGDDNSDPLTITAPTLPGWLILQDHGDGTATLSGTPSSADVGEHAVVLRVADSGGLTDTQAFTLTVANVNDPPEFTSVPVTTATQDVLYTYAVTADDPDLVHSDTLTITAPTLPGWLTLQDHGDGTATLSGTPTEVGKYPVVLRVTDRAGAFTEQVFTITVAERPRTYIFLPLVLRNTP